jgi:hypothetical protein
VSRTDSRLYLDGASPRELHFSFSHHLRLLTIFNPPFHIAVKVKAHEIRSKSKTELMAQVCALDNIMIGFKALFV